MLVSRGCTCGFESCNAPLCGVWMAFPAYELVYQLWSGAQAQFDPAVRERLAGGTCNRSSRRCIGFLHS